MTLAELQIPYHWLTYALHTTKRVNKPKLTMLIRLHSIIYKVIEEMEEAIEDA